MLMKLLFNISCENTKDEIYISATSNHHLPEKHSNIIRKISDEITVYRGINQEDINNKTKNFMIYAAAVINLEKSKGTDKV